MAEVLPPFTQPTSTITMLHPRPSSSDAFQGSQQQYSSSSSQRPTQNPRSPYNNGQVSGYRGIPSAVQPYAFQSTPHLRQDSRTVSAPTSSHGPVTQGLRHKHSPSASASTTSSDASSQPGARDDSVMGSSKSLSGINLGWQLPELSLPSFDQPAKASPERYRRPVQKRSDSNTPTPPRSTQPLAEDEHGLDVQRAGSIDDMAVPRAGQPELAKRYRRRSLNQLETANIMNPPTVQTGVSAPSPTAHGATSTPTTISPTPMQQDVKSVDGEGVPQVLTSVAASGPQGAKPASVAASAEQPKNVQVPARGSSEPVKRATAGPSPLSKQADGPAPTSPAGSPSKPKTYAAAAQSAIQPPSPAAAHLAAVSDRDLNKGMKSRLRRAFSFGSEQQLRRTAGENNQNAAQQARQLHQQSIDDELDAEQLEIARRQEAAGIGAGIYSGQGGFTGSTDNLSISSTASSASMMLRKMGRGAKKGAQNIRGLFRPKSVIGVPAADGPVVQASLAEVSRVTVEAERQNVNVNAHPEELVGGGTGFPKLEQNSLDVAAAAANGQATTSSTTASAAAATAAARAEGQQPSIDGSDSHSRRSIVGSDKDRAEVLAAVKKGILKRSGTASPNGGSPIIRPADSSVPHLVESPSGSLPGTPRGVTAAEQAKGVRSPSTTPQAGGGDYFVQHRIGAKSMPNTPNGGSGSASLPRNISFSPRIQFHDVWSATDYDRRGEVATCNRLTPLLAQQIKEELNTFKMEMEVHELSKPHTHFF